MNSKEPSNKLHLFAGYEIPTPFHDLLKQKILGLGSTSKVILVQNEGKKYLGYTFFDQPTPTSLLRQKASELHAWISSEFPEITVSEDQLTIFSQVMIA